MIATHQALQRVVVRMLYDRPFAEAVFADPRAALEGGPCPVSLPEDAIAWLTATDARAYTTDPLRRTRSLTALLDEYLVSGAWALARAGSGALDAFFSSPAFHQGIQHRRVMSLAFGEWLSAGGVLAGPADAALRPLAQIELALARVRRATPPEPRGGDRLMTSPLVAPLELPKGGLELYGDLRRALTALGPDALTRVLKGKFKCPPPPKWVTHRNTPRAWLLVEGAWPAAPADPLGPEGEITMSIGGGAEGLNGLLWALEAPLTHPEAIDAACESGATPEEARALLSGLIDEGLLVRI